MPSLSELVPEDVVKHLQKEVPGFRSEPFVHQCALATMFWFGGSRRRRHGRIEGAMSFSYKELTDAFGRDGFEQINARLHFFHRSAGWWKDDQHTRAYWFTRHVDAVHKSYMRKHWRGVTRLLYLSGEELKVKALRTLPAAVASLDKEGRPIKDAALWKQAKEMNRVRVDMDTLKRLRKWLRGLLDDYEAGHPPGDLVTTVPDKKVIENLFLMVSHITRLAKTDVAGLSHVPHRYEVAESGRLYAEGYSLQSAPRLVKQAALHGKWEYDFSNCHFTLLAQMAARFGMECPAIAHYLQHKDAVRKEIAEAAGISKESAKKCLLSFVYGAHESVREQDSVAEEVGVPAAKRLYAVPRFQAIKGEITKANRLVLKSWPRNSKGNLVNDCGLPISAKRERKTILAHLLQGAEAAALRIAIRQHPDEIVLLEHDGFVSHARLRHPELIERAIEQELGYRLDLEEQRIQLDPDAQFLRSIRKSEMAGKAMPDKELHASSAR